jgi:hypothetical protein
VGVARVVRQVGKVPAPRTKPGAGVAKVPAPVEETFLVKPKEDRAPQVFVDHTGRRRRFLGWAAFVVACVGLFVVGLLWLSQTGSSVAPGVTSTCPPNAGSSTAAGQHASPGCVAPTRSGR